ncbi:sporulation transcription factor Spo0A [Proteinivorax hydrogeniformans]|uniref:Stage 0 sporulation protein A homolog n=1 Tax=Proteinivorax hydrogeniformans TaxID=1826727 RepID=A0AAU8HQF8_9FIRM
MIKVLIVDDNEEFCGLLSEFFDAVDDIEIVGTAHNGVEALEALPKLEPDVMVLDIIMPHLDGLGVLEKLSKDQELSRDLSVIMLTAFGQEKITKEALELGADYYVLKPFDMGVLVDRIRQLHHKRTYGGEGQTLRNSNMDLSSKHNHNEEVDLEEVITTILLEMGVPSHIKGYAFLKQAITLVIEDPSMINSITKVLYPTVAEKFDTTPSRVERAIRHAIESAWNGRNNIQIVNKLFKYSIRSDKGKPTNSEFIARISDNIRINEKKKVAL